MTASNPDLSHLPETWFDERGVILSRAGVQRARNVLAEADAARTPEQRAEAHRDFLARLNAA